MRQNGLSLSIVVFLAMCFLAGQITHAVAGTSGLCHPKGNAHRSVHPCTGEEHEALQSGGCCCGGSSVPCDCEVKESRTSDQDLPPVSVPHLTGTNLVGTGITNPHVVATPYPTERPPGVTWVQVRTLSETVSLRTTKLLC